jgi:hypothetical protein
LPDGRWFDAASGTWRNDRGRSVRWPDLIEMAQIRRTRVVLAAAHLDHNPRNNRLRNLKSLCQRCHLLHDRPHHLGAAANHLPLAPRPWRSVPRPLFSIARHCSWPGSRQPTDGAGKRIGDCWIQLPAHPAATPLSSGANAAHRSAPRWLSSGADRALAAGIPRIATRRRWAGLRRR